MTEYIVIVSRAWMNETGFGFNHYTDGERFAERADAIRHGFTLNESDDFNVGTVENGRLVAYGWMREDFDDDESLSVIERQLCLKARPWKESR